MTRTIRCRDVDGVTQEVPIDSLAFRPSVYGVIIKEGQVLLHGYKDGWDFPGGGIEVGETIEEALAREIKEETGLTATQGPVLRVLSDFFTHSGSKKSYQSILIYFACSNPSGEISTAFFDEHEKEVARAARWFPIDRLHTLKFFNPLGTAGSEQLARAADDTLRTLASSIPWA